MNANACSMARYSISLTIYLILRVTIFYKLEIKTESHRRDFSASSV